MKGPVKTKKLLTLVLIHEGDHILLGKKKRGFGAGRWNGFGGKVEAGESIEDAALREIQEEAGITPVDIKKRGILCFTFEDNPSEELEVHLFGASKFTGEPMETEEMAPQWFAISHVPYNEMWQDDIHWFPLFFAGKNIEGRFHFQDTDTLLEYKVKEMYL